MSTGKVNVGGGGRVSMNIFTQLAEPQNKNGIWLQTKDKFKTIFQDTNVFLADSWMIDPIANMPGPRSDHGTILYGDFIYVFGGRADGGSQSMVNTVYKYNLTLGTWTLVSATIPNTSYSSGLLHSKPVVVGTIAYFIDLPATSLKRFDLVTETWLTNTPQAPRGLAVGSLFRYLEDTLIFCIYADTSVYIYEYNITSNTWRQVNSTSSVIVGGELSGASSHIINNAIYFISLNGKKYDIATDKWTNLKPTPFTISVSPTLSFGSDIHIYGRGGNNGLEVLIYDTITNTYSYGPPMLRQRRPTQAVFDIHRKKVFLVGGNHPVSGYSTVADSDGFTYLSKQYSQDELVLLVNPPYSSDPKQMAVKLFDIKMSVKNMKFLNYFLNAWIFKDGDLQEYACYYGDGTKWTKFKN